MKKYLLCIFTVLLLTGCQQSPEEVTEDDSNDQEDESPVVENSDDIDEEVHEEEVMATITIDTFDVNNKEVIPVEQLMDELEGEFSFDDINRTLSMSVSGRDFYLVYEVPVLERDGEYLPTDEVLLVLDDESAPYVTKEFIEHGLETDYEVLESNELEFVWEDEVIQAWAPPSRDDFDLDAFTVDEMIEYLSFLHDPIEGAQVSMVESHLPGAPRDYRNGTHEGIDWYAYGAGVSITTETPIYAMAEGTVVRVDHDFEEYESAEVRNEDLELAHEMGLTPEYILDRLRGQQVWVQYDNGVMNRFAHLDDIPEDLELGSTVDENTIIGYVGNSGTSHAFTDENGGLHLHQDLLIYGEMFWEPYDPEEVTQILNGIWGSE
ncbi:M23 family metallopeptidase [Evansella halocellulosilytica]|uniref:M23 family metallopeptidase n=1 Tax=Evansella halocellulosilytica TaxID=2011013 RepID=UPI000BB7AC64|nr:M23 family metallopeptidase [Evansella halocellulosilytica]